MDNRYNYCHNLTEGCLNIRIILTEKDLQSCIPLYEVKFIGTLLDRARHNKILDYCRSNIGRVKFLETKYKKNAKISYTRLNGYWCKNHLKYNPQRHLYLDYNLWNPEVCSSTEKENKSHIISVLKNIYCICDEEIFGKYCELNKTIYLDILTNKYYNHCKYGDYQIKSRKIICVCLSPFYTGQACQINCQNFCNYGNCKNNKGKIICECSHHFLNFFCNKNTYNWNDIILILAIVMVITGTILWLIIAAGLRYNKKKREKIFIKNGTIYTNSSNSNWNKYICKASTDSEYIPSNIHIYQDLSNVISTSKNDVAYIDGYDNPEISDINKNIYYMSYPNIIYNIEESEKLYTRYSAIKNLNLSSIGADDECYVEINTNISSVGEGDQDKNIYDEIQISEKENCLSIIYEDFKLNLDHNTHYDDINVLTSFMNINPREVNESIPLTNYSCVSRRIDKMSNDDETQLISHVKNALCALQLNESILPDNFAVLMA
ncbi:hypothetical protein HZS_7755, partial [Henneguya salminicola]